LWNTGDTTQYITVQPTVTTTYYVQVTDPCGSPVGVDTVTVYLPSTQALQAVSSGDLSICDGDQATLSVSATGGSQPYTYTWTTVAGPDSVPNPASALNIMQPTGSGTFLVTVQEGCGTIDQDTVHIVFNECSVFAPNVFTPGGDGNNDMLVFDGLEDFPGSSLLVFNRWGNKVFEDSDYTNDWTGGQLSDGTYYYILTLNDGRNLTGFVTLINEK
jgi:gliding motility-associated-like protein